MASLMAQPSLKRAAMAVQDRNTSSSLSLDDNMRVKVLLAAQAAGTLPQWASLSKQMCETARSQVPVRLFVGKQQQAGLINRSDARGRPPFSGCTELAVRAGNAAMCCTAVGVLDIAQQWPALEVLQLHIGDFTQQQQQQQQDGGDTVENCASSLLRRMRALQQLRRLRLGAPSLGSSSAQLLLRLTQLTCLHLTAPATSAAAAATADLAALSGFTHLAELHLNWALAPHLPAGPEGPYCFPSSLVKLELISTDHTSPAPMAHWVAHLPGCRQLQFLDLWYGGQQHASAHPSHVVRLLASHHTQLHSLRVSAKGVPDWGAAVAGMEGAEVPVGGEWQANADLAALTGLRYLSDPFLCVRDQADWQSLAQLTALTQLVGVTFHCAPPLQGGSLLALEWLNMAYHSLDGHALGRLLLACPNLQLAAMNVEYTSAAYSPTPAMGPNLPSHPTLSQLDLGGCIMWGHAAAAVAQFAALAPVLGGVEELMVLSWPAPTTRGAPALPDLTPCTAVTSLRFSYEPSAGSPVVPRQEDFLFMVAPLVQLEVLNVVNTSWVNPQVALPLQYMLPQLQCILLTGCGQLTIMDAAAGAGGMGQQQEVLEALAEEESEALWKVERLLRPSLELYVA